MAEEIKSRSAPFTRDGQMQKSLPPQPVIIFDWMRGISIMLRGSRREIGREFQASIAKAFLFRGDFEVHAWFSPI
jgi:hypothetical protein